MAPRMTEDRLAVLEQRSGEIHPSTRMLTGELIRELRAERRRNALAEQVAADLHELNLRVDGYASRRDAIQTMRRFLDAFAPVDAEPRWRGATTMPTDAPSPHSEAAPAPHTHQ